MNRNKNTSERKIALRIAIQTPNNVIRGLICFTVQMEKYGVIRNCQKDLHQKIEKRGNNE
jgi:hypothetical protein